MTTTTVGPSYGTTIVNATVNTTETTLLQTTQNPIIETINTILNIRFEHPWMLTATPILLLILFMYVRKGGLDRKKTAFFIVRAVLIVLLVAALASPRLYESTVEVTETPPVRILLDGSPSMSVYGNKTLLMANGLGAALVSSMENTTEAYRRITMDVLSLGDRTPLGDELYRVLTTTEDSGIVVLFSDGNSNYGKNPVDVARQLGKSNTTVYTVYINPVEEDVYIAGIEGDEKVTSQFDYEAEIEVKSTSLNPVSYKLSIQVDNVRITSMTITQNSPSKRIPVKFSFNGIGVHQVTAQLTSDVDNNIKLNDRFYKTVEVVEKPRMLVVTNKTESPLGDILGELYSVELSDRIRSNLKDYGVVYLDDVNANAITPAIVERLKEHLLDGNGLVVVGGRNSFDYGNYNNSYFETLLPVMSMEKPVERRKKIAVVILVDISGSTEYGVSEDYRLTSKIDFEKALAIKVLRNLDVNDSVGVLAFNTVPYTIAPLERLGERRVDMEDDIVRLRFGGGTEMLTSLDMAGNLLKYYAVNKYVIILSDGVIKRSSMPRTIEKARELASQGIKVYAVGIGFDTDETFMQELAEAGKGNYFKPEAYQRINIEFGRELEEETKGLYLVDVRDEYHFITKGVNVSAQLTGYNKVYERSVAQLLLTTKGGNPVLTVWNFGLGRVAALTTDDGTEWGGNLYAKGNSRIISSMTNWALGDLEKSKKVHVKTEDVTLGQTALIRIDAESKPTLKVERNDMKVEDVTEVKTTGLKSYSTSFKPNETGFYKITATSPEGADLSGIAVNYPKEYIEVQPDLDRLSAIARAGNGRLYYESELDQLESDILEEMQKLSTKTITKQRPLYPYLIALMLLLYFMDTVVRRMQDIRRLRE